MQEARFYTPRPDGGVQCALCPHTCVIADDKVGICRVRKNVGGKLYSLIHGECTSVAMDPVEKKPLYHFFPGTSILSLGTNGCNFACSFCQNWQISQQNTQRQRLPSEQAVAVAAQRHSVGIAYTYNEPLIWYEYVIDTARLVRERGMKNVLVTNGFINPEPLAELLPYVDALNIDIKSIRDEFYRTLCKGRLAPVLETAKAAKQSAHVEITNLIVPGQNDSDADLTDLADWVAAHLGEDTPVHLSAYTPRYQLQAQATPVPTLERAFDVFSSRLRFVYIGNVLGSRGSNTHCHSCGSELITRIGYSIQITGLRGAVCARCGADNAFVVTSRRDSK